MPFRLLLAISLLAFVAACGSPPRPTPVSNAPVSKAPAIAGVKIGKPYQVFGKNYVPSDDRGYDQKGIASWYGPTFHEKATANGEIYDQDGLTAAHKTLPMPSWVEVTNFDNGRKLVVRINDRGPFVDGRIIDLSRRSAQLLGVDGPGLANVRVKRIFPEGDWARASAPVQMASATPAPVQTVPVPTGPVQLVSAAPAIGAATGSYVQVAALSDEGRARALVSVLGDFGQTFAARAPNGMWRVRIGPVAPDQVQRLLWNVQQAGYHDARLVP